MDTYTKGEVDAKFGELRLEMTREFAAVRQEAVQNKADIRQEIADLRLEIRTLGVQLKTWGTAGAIAIPVVLAVVNHFWK